MLRIIVADRQPEMQWFFRRMLPRMGYQLLAVLESGLEVLVQCRTLRPDLLIMDSALSAGNDAVPVDQICRDCQVPVIILTAETLPNGRNHNVPNSCIAYLTKPVGWSILEAQIPQVVRHYQEFKAFSKQTGTSDGCETER